MTERVGRTTSDLSERPPGRVLEGLLAWVLHGRGNPSVAIVGGEKTLGASSFGISARLQQPGIWIARGFRPLLRLWSQVRLLPLVLYGSDYCTICTVGANLTTHMVTVWQWGKTKVNRLLCKSKTDHLLDKAGIDHLPYEIVAMTIAHFTYNLDALKACSLTCRSWYTAAVPLLHHTLTLTGCGPQTNHTQLEMLSELHEFGLIPLVRQIRVEQSRGWGWFVPWALNDLHLCYFSAFTNVHTLRLQDLGIHNFIPGIERYFEHFSPTLRSIALSDPRCTPQQLSHFLSLFTNLDNIEIQNTYTYIPDKSIPDTELVPFSVPKLRGWLLLGDVSWAETWTNLITLCGSLRFRYMDLRWSGSCTPTLLEACAETLETVRFDTTDSEFRTSSSTGLS